MSKGEGTQEDLLDAALTLFLQFGYDNVTTRQIAEKAGKSKGGLTYHFNNKIEILEATISHFFSKINNLREEMKEPANFEEMIHSKFKQLAHINKQLSAITGIEDTTMNYHQLFLDCKKYVSSFNITEVYFRPSFRTLEEFITKCKDSGELNSDIKPEILSFQVLSIMEGSYIIQFYDDTLELEKMLENMASDIVRRVSV